MHNCSGIGFSDTAEGLHSVAEEVLGEEALRLPQQLSVQMKQLYKVAAHIPAPPGLSEEREATELICEGGHPTRNLDRPGM